MVEDSGCRVDEVYSGCLGFRTWDVRLPESMVSRWAVGNGSPLGPTVLQTRSG